MRSFTTEKLQGIRFLGADPLVLQSLPDGAARIGDELSAIADVLAELLPDPSDENVLLLRMGLLSINAAVQAAARTNLDDDDDDAVVAATPRSAAALIRIATETPRSPGNRS